MRSLFDQRRIRFSQAGAHRAGTRGLLPPYYSWCSLWTVGDCCPRTPAHGRWLCLTIFLR